MMNPEKSRRIVAVVALCLAVLMFLSIFSVLL